MIDGDVAAALRELKAAVRAQRAADARCAKAVSALERLCVDSDHPDVLAALGRLHEVLPDTRPTRRSS